MSKGILSKKDVWAELGDIIAGTKPARTSNKEITIFDSTGLAIQDAATTELVYNKATSRKIGCFINIWIPTHIKGTSLCGQKCNPTKAEEHFLNSIF